MSKIFYDHLIVFEEVETEIKKAAETSEERKELWCLVDETIHHRVLGCILDKLPGEHHHEFLTKFHKKPHDETLIDFLKERGGQDFEEVIKGEIEALNSELLEQIKSENSKP